MIGRYRKKPLPVEVVYCVRWEYGGKEKNNFSDIQKLNGGSLRGLSVDDKGVLHIHTLYLEELAYPGDYIVRDVWGELHAYRSALFESYYEPVTE